ncbi:Xanthine and CO dehydrogenase maturation factor, XdhC/CoxF family [Sulfobacillus thermosulfidooxidans DSM 9293]|uniref:Xanthine and CO dehydrogenase maturation factor, XdhC/CoxF family n=1 Tax=Sulfobacillus thermosulfidooxidans (strain DSM 9293 / VKM B-1269 / AT-1) TaxID=929705 RepID=A0A1W1WI55_SULTA|nr:XdhC family protein [Sulfobacillus thermosulfidooxidans]SMC05829.1 Xanthine and CO dehydrogenase maturation factor, XdhC/CoxF family [Sulfobacillus thermosulfidooxidans DSM 9293]
MSSIQEARNLWTLITDAEVSEQRAVLATLVRVNGSAYRRPGAKMVKREDGRMQGTLSGGCLEGDLFLHAQRVMKTHEPCLQHYDLTEDDMWGLGIGCKGRVDIWLEPIRLSDPFWTAFNECVHREEPVIWGAELPSGRRFLFSTATQCGEVPPWASAIFASSENKRDTGFFDGFWWDLMKPPTRLVIAGAGHDAEPVAQLARQVGFAVTIVDPRPHVNNDRHFPQVIHCLTLMTQINPDTLTGAYWVIMNHHQRRDEEALTLAAASHPQFVGVLGPLARTLEMLTNVGLTPHDLPLHAPVGLDVGGETPEEVAVSIVGELMASRKGTKGGTLHGREHVHS